MSLRKDRQASSCGGGCSGCGEALDKAAASGASGWRLAGGAMGVFLVPPVAAMVGAWVVGGSETGQFVGAVVGLALGVAIAAIGARLLRKPRGKGA